MQRVTIKPIVLSVVFAQCQNEAHFATFYNTECHGTIGAKEQRTSAIILNAMAPWEKRREE